MSLPIRLFLTALLVVALAAGGAIFIGYHTGILAGQSVLQVATTGDLRDLFAQHDSTDAFMADIAVRKLENSFYRPIAPSAPVTGEVAALHHFLSAKKI